MNEDIDVPLKQVFRRGLDDYIYINLKLQMIFEIHKSIEYPGVEVIVNQIYSMSLPSVEYIVKGNDQDNVKAKFNENIMSNFRPFQNHEVLNTNIGAFLNSLSGQSLIPLRVETIGTAIFSFHFLDRFIFPENETSKDVLEELLSIGD